MNYLPPSYQSYMLRLWRPSDDADWRIQLESVHSGERQSFSELSGMVQFLQAQIQQAQAGDRDSG